MTEQEEQTRLFNRYRETREQEKRAKEQLAERNRQLRIEQRRRNEEERAARERAHQARAADEALIDREFKMLGARILADRVKRKLKAEAAARAEAERQAWWDSLGDTEKRGALLEFD